LDSKLVNSHLSAALPWGSYSITDNASDGRRRTNSPAIERWIAERDADRIGRISNLMGGGNVQSATGNLVTPLTPKTICTKDTDCINSGQGCGGDVCSHQAASPTCVLSISGDPGYCNVTSDCWCTAEGAACNAATHRCSIVSH
jgi:hypothetical protein